ncbi:hypothetical protein CcCBS67573_g01323 [Chytriomyces confervae]|uniref:CBS domain-containing protein n=1 Tax=Chytriomyces confervae TaxID=246404 RepID=A0A507FQX4_9FUNG|nr:hypothetical protein CcCBS67573_g01323 [Chytriomyces confervae]
MLALITLVSSCFAMATAGAMFSFSVVANSLKDRLGISSTDLNTITAVGNSSLYLSFLAVGPVYDRVGARWTLILGAVIYCLGYALMYLGYEHKIASTTAAMSVYYFIVGIGSTCSYMGCIGANVKNFNASPHEGKVLGLLLLFYGLSASLFAQIANAFFADRGAGALLLFSAAVCGIVNFLAGCFTFEVGTLRIVAATTAQVGDAHGNRLASAKSPAASIRPNANGEVSHIDGPKPGGSTALVKTFDSDKVDGSDVQLSPIDILRHPLFWCLSATFVFMQGLTYITNFVTILEAAVGEREATEHADRIVTQNSIQVTVMSVFNSLGRLTLPIFCEVLQKKNTPIAMLDRSMLLLACQVLIFIPTATLATGAGSEGVFYMSSILISYGFGGAGALFPVLTKDFFGMHAYQKMDGQAQISHPKRKLDEEEEETAAAKKSGALPTVLQSPAIKRTFAPAEVSPMKGIEESSVQHECTFEFSHVKETAITFLKQCDLLRIEDILPFFPDFALIDDFKTDLCQALDEYNEHIEQLKEEMDEATRSAENIRTDIHNLKNRSIVIHLLESASLARKNKIIQLRQRLDQNSGRRFGGKVNDANLTGLKEELEKELSGECPLCNDVIIKSVNKPFGASRILVDNRLYRLPLVDDSQNAEVIVSVVTEFKILRHIAENYQDIPVARKTLRELGLGTYTNLKTATADTPLITVLNMFVKDKISAVPIQDEKGLFIDIYEKYDVLLLTKEGSSTDLSIPLSQALAGRSTEFAGIHTCAVDETMGNIMDTIRRMTVHRFIVLEDDVCKGILSLSDILRCLLKS